MITVYKCEFCGAEFKNSRECRAYEFNEIDKINYKDFIPVPLHDKSISGV